MSVKTTELEEAAGVIDELIVGREVLTEWPRIVKKLCVTAQGR
jgi:hypothetical protein